MVGAGLVASNVVVARILLVNALLCGLAVAQVTIAVQLAVWGDDAADALEDIVALPSGANCSELGLRLIDAVLEIAW